MFALAAIGLAGGTLASISTPTTSYAAGSGGTRPSGTPSGTARPTPTGTQAPRPTPKPGGRDIALLEGALGRALTDVEKTAITTAATKRDTALQAAGTVHKTQAAAAVGLSATELEAKIQAYLKANRPAPGLSFNALVSAALGRTLTDAEVTALSAAAKTRDAAAKAAIDAFRASVAGALSLSIAEIDAKVTVYLQAHPEEGGPNCPPPPATGTGTTGTGTTGTGTTGPSTSTGSGRPGGPH